MRVSAGVTITSNLEGGERDGDWSGGEGRGN